MEGKKSNKVPVSSGSKHRQVKPDRKADHSSKVGLRSRKIPQRKTSHFPSDCPSAYVPYKNDYDVNQFRELLSRLLRWETPSEFVLNSDWLVASGEESEETTIQKLRETSVQEAVYPRFSEIPLSPLTTDVEDQSYDDSQTPVIPIIPMEDWPASSGSQVSSWSSNSGKDWLVKSATKQCHSNNAENVAPAIPWPPIHSIGERTYGTGLAPKPVLPRYPLSTSTFNSSYGYAREQQDPVTYRFSPSGVIIEKQQISQPRYSADPFAKAYAVRTNHNSRNPSQPDLAVIRRMIKDYGLVDNSLSISGSTSMPRMDDLSVAPLVGIPEPTQHPFVFGASPFSAGTTEPPSKDLSYYQSFIKQHGDVHHNKQSPHTLQRPETQALCFYFNTPKGCRNGSYCHFRHEVSDRQRRRPSAISEAPDAKRKKHGPR